MKLLAQWCRNIPAQIIRTNRAHRNYESQMQDPELTPVITWLEGKFSTQNDLKSKVWGPVRYGITI